MKPTTVNIKDLKKEAMIIGDDTGENKEYNRALCELIAAFVDIEDYDTETTAKILSVELGIPF